MNAWEWHATHVAANGTGLGQFFKWMVIVAWRSATKRLYYFRDAPLGVVMDWVESRELAEPDEVIAAIREARRELALRIRRARRVTEYGLKLDILRGVK